MKNLLKYKWVSLVWQIWVCTSELGITSCKTMLKVLLQRENKQTNHQKPTKQNPTTALKDQRPTFLYVKNKINKSTKNDCISCNFNFQALDLSGINKLSVYSYLILILITLNILCEKVTASYILYPYIFF